MTEPPILFDINLLGLTFNELLGQWQVTCLRPALEPEPGWSEAVALELHREGLHMLGPAGQSIAGTWQLERHQRLGQPFLVLNLPHAPSRALITRLRSSPDGELRQMIVYFQSGLELLFTQP